MFMNILQRSRFCIPMMGSCCCKVPVGLSAADRLAFLNSGTKTNFTQLAIQEKAPKWSGPAIVNGTIKDISIDDYKGKYLVFFFYPLDFSFVCPTELIAFSDRVNEFKGVGCEVVACSTDSVFSHFAWTSQPVKQGGLGPVNFPLLSDGNHKIAKAYNVFKEDDGTTFRGLFVIDSAQNLRQITINDIHVGRSVDETLRLIQAFQYTDIHGEVCQAGWKPGDTGIKLAAKEDCPKPCPD